MQKIALDICFGCLLVHLRVQLTLLNAADHGPTACDDGTPSRAEEMQHLEE